MHYKSGQVLGEVEIAHQGLRVLNKLQTSIHQKSKKEPGCDLMLELLSDVSQDLRESKSLLLCNVNILKKLFALFEIDTEIKFSSSYDVEGAKKTERISRLLEYSSCKSYLTGVGGLRYLEAPFFEQFDVQIIGESQGASIENCMDFLLRFGGDSGQKFNEMLRTVKPTRYSLQP